MVEDKCREEFIKENLPLVNHLCKRFTGRGIEYDDLYGAGCVGLVKAADNYDKTLGFQFSTYAVPVILGEIRRLFRDGGSIKVSRSLKELSLRIAKEKSQLENKLGVEPTVSEIASAVAAPIDEVIEALNSSQPTVSLTAISEDGEKQTDVPFISEESVLDDKLLIDSAISKLPPYEQAVIKLRFFEQLTQSETAKRLGTTQVGISRAEKRILLKLRNIIDCVA